MTLPNMASMISSVVHNLKLTHSFVPIFTAQTSFLTTLDVYAVLSSPVVPTGN